MGAPRPPRHRVIGPVHAAPLRADEIKYFASLRSVYFDGDIHYENEYAYFIERDPVAHAGLVPMRDHVTSTGRRHNDGPIGSALLWAPFYVAADGFVVVARWLGSDVPRDGFSWPYVWAVSARVFVLGNDRALPYLPTVS